MSPDDLLDDLAAEFAGPSGGGRPFKDWVAVPDEWPRLALDHVQP
jgi:hypothetical protein